MFLRYLICILILPFFVIPALASDKTIIAQASSFGGLIANTLPATTLAIAQNIDFLELQVVLTADNKLLVFQDLTLNGLTNVAKIFPDRSRKDGSYFVIDFTLQEIRQLRLVNPFDTGNYSLSAPIPTLTEELGLIRRLEERLNKKISLTIEIKHPWFFKKNGKDISTVTLDTLHAFGYGTGDDTLFLQSYNPEELQRIHDDLLPAKQMNIPLIQMIESNDGNETKQLNEGKWEPYNYDWLFTNVGLRMIATYAFAIALPAPSIVDAEGKILLPQYIEDLHKYGLQIFTYSLNDQPEDFPPFAHDFSSLLNSYFTVANIDGAYTNSFADILQYLHNKNEIEKKKTELPDFFSTLKLSRPTPAEKKPIETKGL